jgi:hypothetical protein
MATKRNMIEWVEDRNRKTLLRKKLNLDNEWTLVHNNVLQIG